MTVSLGVPTQDPEYTNVPYPKSLTTPEKGPLGKFTLITPALLIDHVPSLATLLFTFPSRREGGSGDLALRGRLDEADLQQLQILELFREPS